MNGTTGYGIVSWYGKLHTAHRWSYVKFRGPIPRGHYVCHKCDVRACVNPDHLWAGSPKENTADMIDKGRQYIGQRPKGSKHYKAKLTEDDVRVIRAQPVGSLMLAERYGVTYSSIKLIRQRRTWKHVK